MCRALSDSVVMEHELYQYFGSTLKSHGAGEDSGEAVEWSTTWSTLLGSFGLAGSYTLLSGFVTQLKQFQVLSLVGWESATRWGWVLSPSFGYIGQGMIMGPRTAWSMLGGALIGEVRTLAG